MAQIKWLEKQIAEDVLPMLARLSGRAEIEQYCQELIASWQDPGRSEEYIGRNLYTTTRKRIRESDLPTEVKLCALDVIDIPTEQWIEWNERHEQSLEERLADPQFIREPDAIVERARSLLLDLPSQQSEHEWPRVAVGLAVCTGRRFAEVMKKATFEKKTSFSVLFTGPVKRRDAEPPLTFEIPTLCEADLVCEAVAWLRAQVDCSLLSENEVSSLYGRPVRQMTDLQFHDLIPNRSQKVHLYTQICRAVYCLLADFYFGPFDVPSLVYREAVLGHFKKTGATGPVRHAYTSAAHYFDYVLLDAGGEPDNRRGIRLGQPGVVKLEVFQKRERWKQLLPSPDEPAVADGRQGDTGTEPKKKKKKNAIINVTPDDRDLFVDLNRFSLRKGKQSEALRYLIEFYRTHQNIALSQLNRATLTFDDLALTDEDKQTIREGMAVAGETDLLTFLAQAGVQIAKKKVKEAEYLDVDFTRLPTKKLLEERRAGALKEKVRRAVIATVWHNREVQDPVQRWFLNANVVRSLVGGRPDAIRDILLAEYAQRLERHHARLQIKEGKNRNPKLAPREIELPDDPEMYTKAREAELLDGESLVQTIEAQEM